MNEQEAMFKRSLIRLEGVVNSALKSMRDYKEADEETYECFLKIDRELNKEETNILIRINKKLNEIERIVRDE